MQPYPIHRRRDVGHQRLAALLPADAVGDALDAGRIKPPRVGVEPDPGGMAWLEMAQIVFLVVCLHAPRMPVHDGDRRVVRRHHIASLQDKVGDVAVDGCDHLRTAQAPLGETGRRVGGRDGTL